MRWRIYYDNGSTYSDEDGPVEHAPCNGVMVVVQLDPTVGIERLYYKHFYVWSHEFGRWLGLGDQRAPGDGHWGLFDYLARPGWCKVTAGRTVPYDVFAAILDRAQRDPAFQAKSAILPTEEGAPR